MAPLATALQVQVVTKWFPAVGAAPARQVLGRLRFEVTEGERVVLTGPSGCGKTTLLNLVAGIDRDFEGAITTPPATRLAYVFQEPRLLPWRTVEQNLALVLPEPPNGARIARALREVGLEEAGRTFASRLSLGMARRVAIARALVVEPQILLLDEPFVSLDEPTARRLRLLLLDLLARHRITTLFVTHQLSEAIMLADRLVVLGGTPAGVVREIRVELTQEARRDPLAIEALRARLIADRLLGLVEEEEPAPAAAGAAEPA